MITPHPPCLRQLQQVLVELQLISQNAYYFRNYLDKFTRTILICTVCIFFERYLPRFYLVLILRVVNNFFLCRGHFNQGINCFESYSIEAQCS